MARLWDHKPPIKPLSLPDLVINGLGYCCVWWFFQHNKRTALIAVRLGLSSRTVREWKSRVKSGCLSCDASAGCVREKFRNSLFGRRASPRGQED